MKKQHRTTDAGSWDLTTDVLVEILVRLPSSSRRRARLVCRLWCDLVINCTTEMQSRPKLLLWNHHKGVAHVVDDLSPSSTGSCTELWRSSRRSHNLQLVGTCNGLLCLCNNRERLGGAVTLANPATGETLPIPPLECKPLVPGNHRSIMRWGDAYSFAYHPITGRYKVAHVPCSHGEAFQFSAVHVLTVGETTWREVPAGPAGARCNLVAGIVSIDGTTYWIKATGNDDEVAKIVSFDLQKEQVTSTTMPLPLLPASYRLVEVHGRLGVVTEPDVWVLEEGWRWSCRYRFELPIPRRHFVYGEYVLTDVGSSFYGHRTKGTTSFGWSLMCDNNVVLVGHRDEGTLVAKMTPHRLDDYHTFAYVETTEPLGVYATN